MKGTVIGLGKMGAKYWLPYAISLGATYQERIVFWCD